MPDIRTPKDSVLKIEISSKNDDYTGDVVLPDNRKWAGVVRNDASLPTRERGRYQVIVAHNTGQDVDVELHGADASPRTHKESASSYVTASYEVY